VSGNWRGVQISNRAIELRLQAASVSTAILKRHAT